LLVNDVGAIRACNSSTSELKVKNTSKYNIYTLAKSSLNLLGCKITHNFRNTKELRVF